MQKITETKQTQEIKFNNRQLIPFLTALALFIGMFMGGVIMYAINGATGSFNTPSSSSNNYSSSSNSDSDLYDAAYIQDIVKIINNKYLGDVETLNEEDVTYGMVKGIVNSLNDQYTNFLTPEEAEMYMSSSTGDFEGIGVTLSFNGAYTYVESVIKDHPAESAGVLPGDVILTVDGEDVADTLPGLVAQRIRGEKGTDVTLGIYRLSDKASEQQESLDITVTRQKIEIDNVMWEKIDDRTVVIEIVQFSDENATVFNDSWDKVVSEINSQVPNVENVIVDLRGNPGGYVYSVKHVLEDFLDEGQIIMKERSKAKKEVVYYDERDGAFEGKNIVVLVNEGSASASEIFSAAIQENDLGVIVGERTVGKGVEQEMIQLPDGSLFMLVFQEWLTPNGNRISAEEPIQPDYEVEYTLENFKNQTDPQMDKALELLVTSI